MKDIIRGKVEGRRRHGRPKTAYMDNIREWTVRNSNELDLCHDIKQRRMESSCPEDTADHRLRRGPDTSRGQKRQNPCPSSLRASDMFTGVQQLLSVHDNKLKSDTLLVFFGLY